MDYENLKKRELIAKALNTINFEKRGKSISDASQNKELEPLLSDQFVLSLDETYNALTQIRNDINHANFRKDNKKPEDIYREINDILNKVREIVKS